MALGLDKLASNLDDDQWEKSEETSLPPKDQ